MTSKKLLLLVLLTILVFVGLAGYGDFTETGGQLAHFPFSYLIAALALAVVNYGLRFLRWAYLLRVLGIDIPLGLNGLVFLSGLAMSITPGKAGELIKSYLLRDRSGVPVSASAPVVVMERVTDVISVVLLAMLGLALLPLPVVAALTAVLFLSGAALVFIGTRKGDWLFSLPLLRRWSSGLRASYHGLRQLAAPKVLLAATVLGAAAWFSEGLALWVILRGLDADVALSRALPVYAAATLAGALSALPGGLVGTEGSMVALLLQSGVARGPASAATLLVRLATLWLAVAVGLIALGGLNRFGPPRMTAPSSGEQDIPVLQARS